MLSGSTGVIVLVLKMPVELDAVPDEETPVELELEGGCTLAELEAVLELELASAVELDWNSDVLEDTTDEK